MKKKNFAFLILFIFMSSFATTQPLRQYCNSWLPNPEIKKEFNEKILPQIKTQRIELDQKLTTLEKQEIANIRVEIEAIKTTHWRENKQIRGGQQNSLSKSQRVQMREHRQQIEVFMTKINEIAERHHETIERMLGEIRAEWLKVREGWCPTPTGPGTWQKNQAGFHKGFGLRPGRQNEGGFHMNRILTPNGFLLFDPASYTIEENADKISSETLEINVFPNPASSYTQVTVNIEKPSQVGLELLDNQGNILMKKNTKSINEGIFSDQLNLSEFIDGIYLIKTTIGDKTIVRRLIIKR